MYNLNINITEKKRERDYYLKLNNFRNIIKLKVLGNIRVYKTAQIFSIFLVSQLISFHAIS